MSEVTLKLLNFSTNNNFNQWLSIRKLGKITIVCGDNHQGLGWGFWVRQTN